MVQLGRSGIDVFPLALGGNTFGWTSDEVDSHRVLDAYVAGGGNFIDTADSYSSFVPGNTGGESETIIGSWLASRKNRDAVVIGTKVSDHPDFKGLAPANITAALEASLRRLGTDYIDIYYAHHDDPETPLAETIGAFEALLDAGKIRTVGLSNYTGTRIAQWLEESRRQGYEPPAVVQPDYNLVTRRPFEREIAPVLVAEGIAAVPYFALASGFLTGKYREKKDFGDGQPISDGQGIRRFLAGRNFSEAGLAVVEAVEDIASVRGVEMATVAIAWLRSRACVAAPIASARTVAQLPALLASAEFDLTAEEIATLDEVSARID